MPEFYIGLMSGTSLDGVDAVVADAASAHRVLAHAHLPFPEALRAELLALNREGANELHRAALAANELARCYARAVTHVLRAADLDAADMHALGAHGQTVRHRPREFDGTGYTLQLLNPALLAEVTGIATVADFRSRDVAAGGQGAPLVPAFHRARFGRADATLAVLNLGGIANLTLLDAGGGTRGFDCGPGNVLLDLWCHAQTGLAFDAGGAWSAGGQVSRPLLASLLDEPFFASPPPKSTGRDLFHAGWLEARLGQHPGLAARDVQATLAALTASVAAEALMRHAPGATELLVCGGGARNDDLMARLRHALPQCRVGPTDDHGLPADQVEAAAFAWLAWAHCNGHPGNLAEVTGAAGPRVLGAFYPAR